MPLESVRTEHIKNRRNDFREQGIAVNLCVGKLSRGSWNSWGTGIVVWECGSVGVWECGRGLRPRCGGPSLNRSNFGLRSARHRRRRRLPQTQLETPPTARKPHCNVPRPNAGDRRFQGFDCQYLYVPACPQHRSYRITPAGWARVAHRTFGNFGSRYAGCNGFANRASHATRLEPGPGRLVLTTVNHLNSDLWELAAVDARRPTRAAPPDRPPQVLQRNPPKMGLHPGDPRQRGHPRPRRPLTIVARQPLPGTQRVYNLTVEGEHVYYVSELGLLAHNTCASTVPPQVTRNKAQGGLGGDAVRTALQQSKVFELVGEQIKVRTPGEGGHRITDFVVRSKRTGRLSIIEVKTGNATRDRVQLAKDAEIANPLDPTTFFGRRARAAAFPNNTPTGPIGTFEVMRAI